MKQNKIEFTKMHGAGNDYIYVNAMKYKIENPEAFSIKWSKYHYGIGSDGLVLIDYPTIPDADYSMRIFNADGSEAMMCGNGSRCVAKYLHDKGITDKETIRLQTLSGIKILHLHLDQNNCTSSVTVDMSTPILLNKGESSSQFDAKYASSLPEGTFVCMGNPHFVIFIEEDIEKFDVEDNGKMLECHPAFPERCNIEFAQVLPDGSIRMRVWERGSGITMACGTGSCATSVAAYLTGRAGRISTIKMDGGTVTNHWQESDNHILMTGPAEFAFDGSLSI